MLCEKCNEREAVVTLTMVTNGVTRTHHFCPECANQFRLDEINENSELSKTIFRILSETMGGKNRENNREDPEETEDLVCPVCGKTYREFKDDGLLGCQNCAGAFMPSLSGTILSLQGTDTYSGAAPEKVRRRRQTAKKEPQKDSSEELVRSLKNELDSAVLMEDYKKAAEIRDRLREIAGEGAEKNG